MVSQAQVSAPVQRSGEADIVKVENSSKTLFMAIDSLNRKFDRMVEFGDPMATYSDPDVKKVIAALEAYNAALRPFNGNKDVIPISGKNDQEKLKSINRWLGKKEDAPLDPATVKTISDRSKTSFNVVNNYVLSAAAMDTVPAAQAGAPTPARADSIAAALRAQQPPVAAPPLAATVPTQLPAAQTAKPAAQIQLDEVTITAPVPKPAAPAPVAAASGVMTVTVDPIRKNLDDLRFISEYAPNSRARDAARERIASLTKADAEATKAMGTLPVGAERAKKEKARTDANKAAAKFIAENINAAEAAQLRTAAAPFTSHARYKEAAQISRDLNSIENQTSHDIKRLLPGIWLVGETQMGQMLDSLKSAYDLLKAGKEADARMQLGYATAVFDAEQKLYRRMLTDFVTTPANATLSLLSQSTMPGKERLMEILQGNVKTANLLLSPAEIAYPAMAAIFEKAWTDERGIKMLVDAWNYLQQPENQARVQQLGLGQDLNDAFAKAIRMVSETSFNPYITPTFTLERRKAIVALYMLSKNPARGRAKPGGMPEAAEIDNRTLIDQEKELAALFKSSAEYRYNDAFLSVYEIMARAVRPVEGANSETIQSLARLRALRTVIDMNYAAFVNTELVLNKTEASAGKARDLLLNAIGAAKKAGMAEDDPLINAAGRIANETATTPEAAIAAYQAAASLLAIREAQLWVTTPALQWSGYLPPDNAAANSALTDATQLYLATFSGMGGRTPYHPNAARKMAEDAILACAPRLLASTDAPATYMTAIAYSNPAIRILDGKPVKPTESDRALSAIQAEARHIALLVGNMNSPNFLHPSTPKALEDAQLAVTFTSLDPRIGRSVEIARQYGFPVMDKFVTRFGTTASKVDIHIDTDIVPHEDRFLTKWGNLYQEIARQHNLTSDQGAPLVLRGFIGDATTYGKMQLDANVALLQNSGDEGRKIAEQEKVRITDLRTKVINLVLGRMYMAADKPLLPQFVAGMQAAACGFAPPSATPTPQSMAEAVNKVFTTVLDIRIAELEYRLGGATVLSDGKPIRISELAYSKDDRTIANARAFLAAAKGMRERAKAGTVSGEDFQEAIICAENGISLLSDENLRGIERPKVQVGTYVVLDQLSKDMGNTTARVVETHFTPEGRDLTRAEFEKEAGPQEIDYHYYAWDALKRTNAAGQRETVEYLYHPYYRGVDDTAKAEYVPKYVGQVMRGATVKMPDGTTVTGDFVVRVRLTEYRPDQPQWEPVDKGKELGSESVLFQLEAGTRNPASTPLLVANTARVNRGDTDPFFYVAKESLTIPHPADFSVVAVPTKSPLKPEFAKRMSELVPKPATK